MSPRLVQLLVLVALAVPAALLLTPVQAQFGRPGGPRIPPGGMGGRPGGMPGGPGRLGPPEHVWKCSGCGAIVGHGLIKPTLDHCPSCGAKFVNGVPGGVHLRPPPEDPPGGQPNDVPPDNVPPPADNPPPPPVNNNAAPAPAPVAAAAEGDSSKTTRIVLVVAAIGGGALFVFAALGTFLYISVARAAKADVPQRRRKRVYHDDD
jgi:hypothetical protein